MIRVRFVPPRLVLRGEFDGLSILAEFDGGEGEMIGLELLAGGFGKGGGEFRMIKGGLAHPFFGIDENELPGLAAQGVHVPKLGVVGEPVRSDDGFIDPLLRPAGAVATALGRAGMGVIRRGCKRHQDRQE